MKRIVLNLIVTTFLTTSCVYRNNNSKNSEQYKATTYEFEYNGHDYFDIKVESRDISGVVHNPDCRKCHSEIQTDFIESNVDTAVTNIVIDDFWK